MAAQRAEHAIRALGRRTQALPLSGVRILIVEDEAIVALDLEMTLQSAGASTIGPCLRLSDALGLAEAPMDAALLDVRLGRRDSYPLADRLAARGVAIVFHSGHANPAELRARYPWAGLCPKPCTPSTIVRTLAQVIDN